MGPTAHPSGTRPARLRGRRADRRQVHAPDVAAALPDVAGLSCHSCQRHRRRRLLPRADAHVPLALRLRRASPRPPRAPPPQRHGPPLGRLDGSANHRSLPGRERPRDTCFAIATRSTATSSRDESRGWGSARSASPRARPGRTPSSSGSSAPFAASAWIIVLILSEAHLRRLLHAYGAYYNTTRPHQSLDNNSPQPRVIEPPPCGGIIAIPQVGGLHHRYQRVA